MLSHNRHQTDTKNKTTAISKITKVWTAKAKVLQENVEHHVEDEETTMFKLGREVLTQAQIDELGTRLEAEKNKVIATAATA